MAGARAHEYDEYIARFTASCGEVSIGGFTKYNGKLIKKMTYEEFEPLYEQYAKARQVYEQSLDRGDTINDLVVKRMRKLASELVIDDPLH